MAKTCTRETPMTRSGLNHSIVVLDLISRRVPWSLQRSVKRRSCPKSTGG